MHHTREHMLYTLQGTNDYLEAREALRRGERVEMEVSRGTDWQPLNEGIPVEGFKYRVLIRHEPMTVESHLAEIDNIQAEIKKLQEKQQAWVNVMSKRYGPWIICKEKNGDPKSMLYYCERGAEWNGFYPTLHKVKEFKSPRDAEFFADPKWAKMKQPGWEFKVVSRNELPW